MHVTPTPKKPNKFENFCQRNKVGRHLLGPEGILTLNSKHYEWIYVVMEVAQIVSQVFQAYRLSHLIDRVWINRCYVAIVVSFCWTMPLLHRFLRYSTMKHIMCLPADVFLNICYSIVLSLVIFIPYIYEYEPDQYSFNLPFLYGDEIFGKLVLENQLIFAISLLDFCAKFIPQVSAYLSLRSISILVEKNSNCPKLNSFRLLQALLKFFPIDLESVAINTTV
uniref:Uncharacterized protein n=1 Tax=Globisporangium ultimum (strain ATCC 200006 / CBS 805.95 / DAOM BR144) TaxID=431595 RepID=K3WSF4_GLOUD